MQHDMVSNDSICNTNSPDYNNTQSCPCVLTQQSIRFPPPLFSLGCCTRRQAKVGLTIYLFCSASLSINLIRRPGSGGWSGCLSPISLISNLDLSRAPPPISPAQIIRNSSAARVQTRDLGARFRLTEPICFTYDQHKYSAHLLTSCSLDSNRMISSKRSWSPSVGPGWS